MTKKPNKVVQQTPITPVSLCLGFGLAEVTDDVAQLLVVRLPSKRPL